MLALLALLFLAFGVFGVFGALVLGCTIVSDRGAMMDIVVPAEGGEMGMLPLVLVRARLDCGLIDILRGMDARALDLRLAPKSVTLVLGMPNGDTEPMLSCLPTSPGSFAGGLE